MNHRLQTFGRVWAQGLQKRVHIDTQEILFEELYSTAVTKDEATGCILVASSLSHPQTTRLRYVLHCY
jgi:hypothetical protein